MELIKIKLKDLQAYSESEQYKQFSTKPISPLRIESYLYNPQADKEDFVLYMLIEDNELLAFRTLLADHVLINGEYEKFGWYSGTWVHPKYRRLGFSKKLFQESFQDWGFKMMFTNYIDSSRSLFLSTNLFSLLRERIGMRFYLFPDLNEIFKKKKGYSLISWLLPILSELIKLYVKIKLSFQAKDIKGDQYAESDQLDDECKEYLEENYPDSLFGRKVKELSWIIDYPWVTNKVEKGFNYPFSYSGIKYRMKVVKIVENSKITGIFIYSLVNRKMKIIYYSTNDNQIQQIASVILKIAIENNISYLTILEPQLVAAVKKYSKLFIFSKTFESNIYTSFPVDLQEKRIVFDGDGDNCFT